MPSSRLTTTIDEQSRIIVLRIDGETSGSDILPTVMDHYGKIPFRWLYNRLVDLRRFEGTMLSKDIMDWARQSAELDGDHTNKIRVAIVTRDEIAAVRFRSVRDMFPKREVELFTDFDEALDWVKQDALSGTMEP